MPSNDNVQTISRSLIFLFRLVVYKALNFSGDEVQPHPLQRVLDFVFDLNRLNC